MVPRAMQLLRVAGWACASHKSPRKCSEGRLVEHRHIFVVPRHFWGRCVYRQTVDSRQSKPVIQATCGFGHLLYC